MLSPTLSLTPSDANPKPDLKPDGMPDIKPDSNPID